MRGVVRFLAFTPTSSRHEVSFWTISGGFVHFAMEKCLDLALRTEGAAGSVAPTQTPSGSRITSPLRSVSSAIYFVYSVACYATFFAKNPQLFAYIIFCRDTLTL